MTRIFFYHGAKDRMATIASLIRKAYQQKKPLLVYAPDAEMASTLDRDLWITPPTAFIPHVAQGSKLAAQTPVLITDNLDSLPQSERLFNLSPDIPAGFSRFTSVIEIVGNDDEERRAGRERVKFYKDRGYEVQFVNCAESE